MPVNKAAICHGRSSIITELKYKQNIGGQHLMKKDIFSITQDRHLLWGEGRSGWKAACGEGIRYNGISKIQMVSGLKCLENVTDPKITH